MLASSPALAQSAAADVLFEEGRKALAAGDLDTACAKFRASDQLEPAAGTRANLGTCEEKRGKLASAWEAYKSALRKMGDGDKRAAAVRTKMETLEPRLPKLLVTLDPSVKTDAVVREGDAVIASKDSFGTALPFDPGPHTLIVRIRGQEPRTVVVTLKEGETFRLVVGAPEPKPEERPPQEKPKAEETAAAKVDDEPKKRDAVRVRGGLSGGAGILLFSGIPVEPSIHLAGRVGVQFNHVFSLYYQNAANVVILTDGSGVAVFNYNSILANFTFAHMVEIGAGPSIDVIALSGTTSGVAAYAGLHTRFAVNIGGSSGPGPRRRGVSLGLEAHPTFATGGVLTTMDLTAGYEWF